ncbi:MAG: SpoIIE family protein phosphatase [Kiritimatiellae bacterium]|nr:SpoIIE family protein phosphatase [Kiritimatiellia bacterium]
MTGTMIQVCLFSVAPTILLVLFIRVSRRLRVLRQRCAAMLQEKELIYGFVHDVAEVFAGADSIELPQMLKRVLFYALRTGQAGAGAIYMVGADGETLQAATVSGLLPPLMPDASLDLNQVTRKAEHIVQHLRSRPIRRGEGLVGEVADLGTAILIEDGERDARLPQYDAEFLKMRSLMLIPMRFHQEVLGVLVVANRVDGKPFCEADLNLLQALADQATVSIHFVRLREELNEKQRIDHDLNLARSIQASLLPKELPHIEGLELAAFNVPAQEVGGDYYDVFSVDEECLGIAIADVSGKGISGAIMTALCRSVLRAQARNRRSPSEVLREVNHIMQEDVAEDMFITMLYMVFNTKTRELTLARAGHERPLLVRQEMDGVTDIQSAGAALGLVLQADFDRLLNEERIQLNPGSVLVAYTDGVTEALNAEHQEWGIDSFKEAIRVAAREGAHSVLNNVRQRLMRFVGETPQYDDMTMIALRVMPL